jgi:glycosyltransferase involved in cell wall biosynthesis
LGVAEEFLTPPKEGPKEGILMLGRLEWLKNQKTVIQWASKHQWPLTVVGDPNKNQPGYYRECKAAAGQTITFLPHTSGEELLALLDSHKLLVVPSHFESFSLVGWEAAARGMKVLFNEVEDMKETLAPIGEGMDFSDEAACALRIEEALAEPVDIKKSQALLESRSWDQIVMQILAAYA